MGVDSENSLGLERGAAPRSIAAELFESTPIGLRDNAKIEPFMVRKSASLIGSFTPELSPRGAARVRRGTVITPVNYSRCAIN